jgi:hypothetical protein
MRGPARHGRVVHVAVNVEARRVVVEYARHREGTHSGAAHVGERHRRTRL